MPVRVINLARLINRSGTGIIQQIEPIETEIFYRSRAIRQSNTPNKDISEFYRWVEQYVREQYSQRFSITYPN